MENIEFFKQRSKVELEAIKAFKLSDLSLVLEKISNSYIDKIRIEEMIKEIESVIKEKEND